MQHVLDNPAWNALISGNKNLALGTNPAKYFDKEVSPFAGLENNTADNLELLHTLIPHNGPVLIVTTTETYIPAVWKQLHCVKGYQMVFEGNPVSYTPRYTLKSLTKAHVEQMLALTKLTNPGPFAAKTIEFGHYKGIFEGELLVAMAGHRLHPFEYMEISAVCTHPDHLGKGYARELLNYQINTIKASNNIPFLHVRNDNERAIKVYESLGFKTRSEVYFYVLLKNN